MQFKIPQNVQIEDKIVGPLTFKQLFILGGGGGIAYLIYLALAKKYFLEIWLPPVAIVSLATLALAFVKPLGVTFIHYLLLLIEYWASPRKRSWVKGGGTVYTSMFTQLSTVPSKIQKKAEKKRSSDSHRFNNLEEITEILDSHGYAKS